MDWDKIVGQQELKDSLIAMIEANRVGHAYLFVGEEGYGGLPLAMAMAKEIFAKENPQGAERVQHLNHIDLHFSFPVFSEKNKSNSSRLYSVFREAVLKNPYFSIEDWGQLLDSANKQLLISAAEVEEQVEKFSLKSYEGGSKILIMWRADKMNEVASNKLLKFLEEPPEKTTIIMTATSIKEVLPTILSRVQIIEVSRIENEPLLQKISQDFPQHEQKFAEYIAKAQGNYNTLIKLINGQTNTEFEEFFIQWVRQAFQVRKKPEMLRNIITWARTIATWRREEQKRFLEYCAEMFRMALLQNYGQKTLVYKKIEDTGFNWEVFSKYIHGANIEEILSQLTETDYHLERNANPKIVWTDMGIRLSRYIHKKN